MSDWPGICCGLCRIFCFQIRQACCCVEAPPPATQYNVLCLGISNAGKTTLLSVLNSENTDAVIPTVGFSVKDIVLPNATLKVKELGGASSVRQYWNRYYSDVHGVIFVVDGCCNEEDLQETKNVFIEATKDPALSSLPWLLLCNKQDLDGTRSEETVVTELGITESIQQFNMTVQHCTKTNSDALRTTFEQFADRLNQNYLKAPIDERSPMNSI